MGLDMYLSAKRHMWHDEPELAKLLGSLFALPEGIKVEQINVEVAYWRKANQIHDWFVQNVQNGVDECEPHFVSREQLQTLIDLCKRVLENPMLAEELLPTRGGFFFGPTGYGADYNQDLESTVLKLERALQLQEGRWSFEYCSSW